MSVPLPDDEITRLVQIIRTANVRDSKYLEAEAAIVRHGDARRILLTLLRDREKFVRERAVELLKKLK